MYRGTKRIYVLLLAAACVWGCQSSQTTTEVAEEPEVAEEFDFSEAIAEGIASMADIDMPTPGEIEDPEAKAVVDAMYAAYAACDTYSDTGTLEHETQNITFITRYKKPNRLYFEYTSELTSGFGSGMGPNAYWTKGIRGDSDYDVMGMKSSQNNVLLTDFSLAEMYSKEDWPLAMAVASFTGVSMHAGTIVPTLILPDDVGMGYLSTFSDLVYEGTETVRDIDCDVLYSEGWDERFWVNRKTHMLIRVHNGLMGMYDEPIVMEYWPVVNGEIDDKDMVFVVPN